MEWCKTHGHFYALACRYCTAERELRAKVEAETVAKIVAWLRERTSDAERSLFVSNDPEARRLGKALREHNLVLADLVTRGEWKR